jgi:hypothetical protein
MTLYGSASGNCTRSALGEQRQRAPAGNAGQTQGAFALRESHRTMAPDLGLFVSASPIGIGLRTDWAKTFAKSS